MKIGVFYILTNQKIDFLEFKLHFIIIHIKNSSLVLVCLKRSFIKVIASTGFISEAFYA
jgi:hypothetical protein